MKTENALQEKTKLGQHAVVTLSELERAKLAASTAFTTEWALPAPEELLDLGAEQSGLAPRSDPYNAASLPPY